MSTNNPHVETIVRALADLLDGQPVPPQDSTPTYELSEAIRALQADNSPRDYEMIGLKALGLVINRCIAGFATHDALRNLGGSEA
jgi:hypothetical protein